MNISHSMVQKVKITNNFSKFFNFEELEGCCYVMIICGNCVDVGLAIILIANSIVLQITPGEFFFVKSVFYFMLMDSCGNPLVMTLFGKPF